VAAVDIREAAVIPAAVAAAHISRLLIFLQPAAAEHLISPLAPRLTLAEVARASLPACRTAPLLFMQRFTVLRAQQELTML
jgi:hypothetical protein